MIDLAVDTTAIVDILRGRSRPIFLIQEFDHPAASHVVFGELLFGSMKSNNPREKARLFQALEGVSVLQGDASTSNIYARLRWQLEKAGTPVPQNDIWIAAAAIQSDVPLLSRDRHFDHIQELDVLSYQIQA